MEQDDSSTSRSVALRRARLLRRRCTSMEKRLWARLRDRQLAFKFRRQQPAGRFVADFYCHACRLVIEVDGDSHADSPRRDLERTAWLEGQGYHVIRFTNEEVRRQLDAVLEAILARCEELLDGAVSPDSPP